MKKTKTMENEVFATVISLNLILEENHIISRILQIYKI